VEFLSLEGDACATKCLEYLPQVFHMLPRRLQEDDDVVEVHEATLPLEPPEDHVDGPLEGRWGVLQTKGDADFAIFPLVTDEGRPITILVRHGDLRIPRVTVERGKHLGVPEEIDTVVHAWQRVHVSYRHLVELSLIHAKPHRSVGFRDRDHGEGPLCARGLDNPEVPFPLHRLRDDLP